MTAPADVTAADRARAMELTNRVDGAVIGYTPDSPAAKWVETGVFDDTTDDDEYRVSFEIEEAVASECAHLREALAELARLRGEADGIATMFTDLAAKAYGGPFADGVGHAYRAAAAVVRSKLVKP